MTQLFKGWNRAGSFLLATVLSFSALCTQSHAGEVELKSLQPLDSAKKKYGSYVGVFGGATTSEGGNLELDYLGKTLGYDLLEDDGNMFVGIEVGYSWKTKYFLEFGLEFEGIFSSSEVGGFLSDANAGVPIALSDVATASADLNYAAFMLNGVVTLDLKKLKPRIGGIVPKIRPYIGGGVGGAQVWFRNQTIQTVGDLAGIPTAPSSSPFAVDEFVFACQLFGGVEIQINDKVAIYGEYRQMRLEKVAELSDFESDIVLGGVHIRY